MNELVTGDYVIHWAANNRVGPVRSCVFTAAQTPTVLPELSGMMQAVGLQRTQLPLACACG